MARKKLTTLVAGDGPFAIQPGTPERDLIRVLGEPFDREADPTVGGPAAKAGIWEWAIYMTQVRVDVPLGSAARITDTSLTLRFHYRTDTGIIWGIGITDDAGVFRSALGAVSPTTRYDEAVARLGEPQVVCSLSDVYQRCLWTADGLLYVAEFFAAPHRDFVRDFRAGDQNGLDVFVVGVAPTGYVERLLSGAEPGAAPDPRRKAGGGR